LSDIFETIEMPPRKSGNRPDAAGAMEQLAMVFAAYSETTDRMQQSYQQLQGEVKRLREELAHKNALLERKSRLAALGEMAAGMAHEIRNPLGGLQLYASLLERNLLEEPAKLKWVHKIHKGIHSLDRIVNDILAFTHDHQCDKQTTGVAALVEEVLEYVQPMLQGRAIAVDASGVERGLAAEMDVHMMHRILLNLVVNAIEILDGSGKVELRGRRMETDPGYSVQIEVADTGPGIPAEILDKIFHPFFTTKDAGTGLGLAIVHRLVECHGGLIRASNRPTGGAVFTIFLP